MLELHLAYCHMDIDCECKVQVPLVFLAPQMTKHGALNGMDTPTNKQAVATIIDVQELHALYRMLYSLTLKYSLKMLQYCLAFMPL